MTADRIFLVGPRAAGKTTVAKALAGKLHAACIDADDAVEARAGCAISELVSDKGWDAFRHLESFILYGLCRKPGPLVAATGGGAVLDADNRKYMRMAGRVVFLDVDPAEQAARLARDAAAAPDKRPALTSGDAVAEAAAVFAERRPLYEECAHVTVSSQGDPEAVAEAILGALASLDAQTTCDERVQPGKERP